ncbi:MAG: DsrE family protein [Candidatus Bathyarchaeota archaeon]|nr:DsrE family protein [Candidatus Bathyarchaeota archaeon]MDH5418809.1 DsrE family protein [Candidatus Bathyarchaeota archaeon]MDH5623178.1 DsrE family protein [Candidatus Bathyarchaeota archaeon]MDH5635157.1 DsrE family protein [Candidatus Bathyarchaeota archaeon]MDH5701339.1 DsrE family protein [Candidatus Bathyarchaeota archaeon]
MPRKILLVTKSSPYGSLMAAEGFRIATAMVAMDVLPKLLFIDDGVYCLLKNQRPEAAGLDSHYERLKTLADLVGLYALRDSVVKRNLKIIDLDESFNVKLLSKDEAVKLIVENEAVMAF